MSDDDIMLASFNDYEEDDDGEGEGLYRLGDQSCDEELGGEEGAGSSSPLTNGATCSMGAGEQEYAYFEEATSPYKEMKSHKPPVSGDDTLREMYRELQLISAQLKTKNMELSQRERQLADRELRLVVKEEELEIAYEKFSFHLHKTVDFDTAEKHKNSNDKLGEYQDQVKEKVKENKRLRASFDIIQEANAKLQKQYEEVQAKNGKLEKQCHSLKHRLENLQRCQELRDRQTENIVAEMKAVPLKTKHKAVRSSKSATAVTGSGVTGSGSDVFIILLEWTIKDILKPSFERGKTLDGSLRVHILENCQKMLPSLVEIIKEPTNQSHNKLTLPCLQFIYWSCLLLDHNPGKQNVGLGGAQRKLAEELYRPMRPDENIELCSSNQVFVKSSDPQMRLLSCLLLLRNLTQVDWVANVLSLLKHDLRDDLVKELFVFYHGTSILLSFCKPTSKAQLPVVLDIYMLMCVESSVLRPFLMSCSTEAWFRSVSMVLRIPTLDLKQLEKVSVILQKLSKIRENRKHFEMFSLKTTIQDILHATPSNDSNCFLVLNLKSVLFNLSPISATASD